MPDDLTAVAAAADRGIDVSVIIVTRNTCALTLEAVASVFTSDDALGKEVIVVDNGSTDATDADLAARYPTVTRLRSPKNLGFARANNWGAQSARGEFLLLLNSDARLTATALARAVGWMRENPQCGVAGAQLLNPDGTRQNSIANFPTLATELLNKSLLRRLCPGRFPGKEHRFEGPVEVESVIGAFFLTRKSLWDRLGGFDERFFFFFEETDFCRQVKNAGARVMHLPDVTVWHGQGQTAKQASAGARIEYWRSRYQYFEKHSGALARAALDAGLMVRLGVDWLSSALLNGVTLGTRPRWRHKFGVQSALLAWRLRGRPADAGLPR